MNKYGISMKLDKFAKATSHFFDIDNIVMVKIKITRMKNQQGVEVINMH